MQPICRNKFYIIIGWSIITDWIIEIWLKKTNFSENLATIEFSIDFSFIPFFLAPSFIFSEQLSVGIEYTCIAVAGGFVDAPLLDAAEKDTLEAGAEPVVVVLIDSEILVKAAGFSVGFISCILEHKNIVIGNVWGI